MYLSQIRHRNGMFESMISLDFWSAMNYTNYASINSRHDFLKPIFGTSMEALPEVLGCQDALG